MTPTGVHREAGSVGGRVRSRDAADLRQARARAAGFPGRGLRNPIRVCRV